MSAPIQSPCVKICQLDPRRELCVGCLRTRDEIRVWSTASEEEKRAILARVVGRRLAQSRHAEMPRARPPDAD